MALADSVIVNDRSCWGPKVREARLCVPHLLGGREYIEGEDPTLHANLTHKLRNRIAITPSLRVPTTLLTAVGHGQRSCWGGLVVRGIYIRARDMGRFVEHRFVEGL